MNSFLTFRYVTFSVQLIHTASNIFRFGLRRSQSMTVSFIECFSQIVISLH